MAVLMNVQLFWNVALRRPANSYGRFGRACYLHCGVKQSRKCGPLVSFICSTRVSQVNVLRTSLSSF